MSALTAEQRERLRERFLATYSDIPDEWHAGPATVAEFRALLADSDALAAAEAQVAKLREAAGRALLCCHLNDWDATEIDMLAHALASTAPEREGADG